MKLTDKLLKEFDSRQWRYSETPRVILKELLEIRQEQLCSAVKIREGTPGDCGFNNAIFELQSEIALLVCEIGLLP